MCNDNLNTKSPPGIHSPNCSLSQAKPVLCPRSWEASYVRSRVGVFGLANHSMVSIHGWRHGHPTKKLQLCFARTVWRWLPRLVDRAQVLPETIYESGCGHQEGDFVLRFSSHTHRTIVSQTPSQEQTQLRPAEECLASEGIQ